MEDDVYYRHYKGGIYKLIGFGLMESNQEPMVMYKSLETGKVWVRHEFEFHKKFEIIKPTATQGGV